jgi:hypothetical protein
MLDLSVTVSHAVLALYETPWLSFELMKQNIAVMGDRHASGSKTCVTAPLQRITLPKDLAAPSYIEHAGLFALGILLIELLYGVHIEQLCKAGDPPIDPNNISWATQHAIATRLLKKGEILERGGVRFEKAVKTCIKCDFPDSREFSIADPSFRHAAYIGIVAQLEDFCMEFQQVS